MTKVQAPAHLWMVGILSLLWNGFGAFNYVATQTRNDDWVAGMMPGTDIQMVYDWMDRAPLVIDLFWALGVWFALAGSILLLIRKTLAVSAFAISLVGAVGALILQLLNIGDRPAELGGGHFDPIMIAVVLIAFALLAYARKQKANGVLA